MQPDMFRAIFTILWLATSVRASALVSTQDDVPADWPSYNRTLSGDRLAPQTEITPANASRLHEICRYDVGRQVSFQTGPIVVAGTMFVTTDFDTIALDAATCRERWRTTEHYIAANDLKVNRGAAYFEGRVFRGTQDGRVLAYDALTGRRLWATTIADAKKTETVPAALIASGGRVFAGNAGGDNKGVKGRMYALDAVTGRVLWEQYMVPRNSGDVSRGPAAPMPPIDRASWGTTGGQSDTPITGGANWTSYTLDPVAGELYVPGGNPAPDFKPAMRRGTDQFTNSIVVLDAATGGYKRHMPLVMGDYHDWDVSAAPVLFTTRGGATLMATAAKDGHLYINEASSGRQLRRTSVTTIRNASAPLTATGTRFCPGTQGGTEWNGPAYSAATNLIYTGAVDWCSTVRVATDAKVRSVPDGQAWSGSPETGKEVFGKFDSSGQWAGWIYAHDADSGARVWRRRMAAPVLAGVTPTAGGLLFAGDMAGNLVAFDAATGYPAWSTRTAGSLGGGIISYAVEGRQRIAVASGMVSSLWPTDKVNAAVIVYGLPQ